MPKMDIAGKNADDNWLSTRNRSKVRKETILVMYLFKSYEPLDASSLEQTQTKI